MRHLRTHPASANRIADRLPGVQSSPRNVRGEARYKHSELLIRHRLFALVFNLLAEICDCDVIHKFDDFKIVVFSRIIARGIYVDYFFS